MKRRRKYNSKEDKGVGGNMEGEVEVGWQVGEEGRRQMTFNSKERKHVC